MKIFAGVLITAAVLGGALWLRGYTTTARNYIALDSSHNNAIPPWIDESDRDRDSQGVDVGYYVTKKYKPSWVDPLALFIVVAGVGVGIAIIVKPLLPRREGWRGESHG